MSDLVVRLESRASDPQYSDDMRALLNEAAAEIGLLRAMNKYLKDVAGCVAAGFSFRDMTKDVARRSVEPEDAAKSS